MRPAGSTTGRSVACQKDIGGLYEAVVMGRLSSQLQLGQAVRVAAATASLQGRVGRVAEITTPYVATEKMYFEALFELPLYRVRFNDGASFRFRGRDLEPVLSADVKETCLTADLPAAD